MADIRFQYFSVAVRNLEEGMKRYEEYFGLRPVGEITEQRWGFRGVMLGTDEGPMLEMIEPTRDDSALKRFISPGRLAAAIDHGAQLLHPILPPLHSVNTS